MEKRHGRIFLEKGLKYNKSVPSKYPENSTVMRQPKFEPESQVSRLQVWIKEGGMKWDADAVAMQPWPSSGEGQTWEHQILVIGSSRGRESNYRDLFQLFFPISSKVGQGLSNCSLLWWIWPWIQTVKILEGRECISVYFIVNLVHM